MNMQTYASAPSPTQPAGDPVIQLLMDYIAKNNINAAELLNILRQITTEKNTANPPSPTPPTIAAQPSQVSYASMIDQPIDPIHTSLHSQTNPQPNNVIVDVQPNPSFGQNTFNAKANTWDTGVVTGNMGDMLGLGRPPTTQVPVTVPSTNFQSNTQPTIGNNQQPFGGASNTGIVFISRQFHFQYVLLLNTLKSSIQLKSKNALKKLNCEMEMPCLNMLVDC